MVNLFVWHRPYDVLVSASIVCSLRNAGFHSSNVGFAFNVYNFGEPSGNVYSDFNYLFNYDLFFDVVKSFDRSKEVPLKNIFAFRKYYRTFTRLISYELSFYHEINNVFIFSDKEKPVEIIAKLAKEKCSARIILVDEGIAAYYHNKRKIIKFMLTILLKKIIRKSFGYRYIADNMFYGESNIYDYSLSFDPKKSILKGNRVIIPKIDFNSIKSIMKIDIPRKEEKSALYASSAISECKILSLTEEIKLVRRICNDLLRLGFKVTIKKHPVEISNKFDCIKNVRVIEDAMLPAEVLFDNYDVITSINSSTLLNSARSNKLTIGFVNYLGREFISRDVFLNEKNIFTPKNYYELSQIIKTEEIDRKSHNSVNNSGFDRFLRLLANKP